MPQNVERRVPESSFLSKDIKLNRLKGGKKGNGNKILPKMWKGSFLLWDV